jgi:alkylation response protein AidB-like acyl-CoA dehydrogenase
VAGGCVGIIQACADAAHHYSRNRSRGGQKLSAQSLIASMLASIYIDLDAARLLCLQAAQLCDEQDPRAIVEVAIAKQFAALAAMRAAQAAVQIHGAIGCSKSLAVERHYRDAKIMEIIEGTNELQRLIIGEHGYSDVPSIVRPRPVERKEPAYVDNSPASSSVRAAGCCT